MDLRRTPASCLPPALACALAAATACAPALAQPVTYQLDPVHTRVMLAVDHAGFSNALGTVSGSSGQLLFDPGNFASARLQVEVPVARLDFGDDRWNRAVLAPNLLDAARHPQARFVSTRITARGERQAEVCGELTLRGVTGPFCMDVTFNQLRRHPLPPFRRTVGFSASGELSRSAFGMRAWPGMVGDRVQLRIEVEATAGGDAPPPVDAASSTRDTPDRPATAAEAVDAAQQAADALVAPPSKEPEDVVEEHP